MYMPSSKSLFIFLSSPIVTLALPQAFPAAPQPKLTNISYWGSACPADGGLTAAFGPLNTNRNSYPLKFTLSNFLPSISGPFGSSLRMCDVVSTIAVGEGWNVVVNKDGTNVQGLATLPGNVTMFLRSTYSFAESAETQSIGMLDVHGPFAGDFETHLVPEEEDGVVGSCGVPAELVVEFQARAVVDWDTMRTNAANGSSWVLTTNVDVFKC